MALRIGRKRRSALLFDDRARGGVLIGGRFAIIAFKEIGWQGAAGADAGGEPIKKIML